MAVSKIVRATKSISKASDCRDDTKLLMQPYANWEEYLTPAPTSIAILGELVFISSNVDFSINKNPPKDGFKFIRYPESFRACLMQVCNAGWSAFNEAHKNMDQIRIHTGNVPDYIKMSVKILLQDDDELVQTLLPDQLASIDDIAQDCVQLATSTESKFTNVIELIQELLEACVNAKQGYNTELESVTLKLNEAKLRKDGSDEANKRAKRAFAEMDNTVKAAQEMFEKSMNSMPSGWEVLGMNVVEGITNTVMSGMSGMFNMMCQNTLHVNTDQLASNNIFAKSCLLLSGSNSLRMFIDDKKINWSEVHNQKNESSKSDDLKKLFETYRESINNEKDCEPKQWALDICEKGISLCMELTKHAPMGKCEETKTKELIEGIQVLTELVQCFDSKSKAYTNTPAFPGKPPQMSKAQADFPGTKKAGEIAADNARLCIEQSKAQLDKVRELQKESLENMEKNEKELTEILIEMRNCDVKKIDFKTTIKMLVKGMEAMGRVKEQWEKMVRFFQMVSNIIKTSMSTSLKRFLSTAEKASAITLTYSSKQFMKDMLYNQAFYASNIASLVNMISGTYTEVSEKYLMDQISSLGRLMSMDPNNREFQIERNKLQHTCEVAQAGIRRLVQSNKNVFDRKTNARLAQIKEGLLAVMPPASEEDTKKLRKAVASGFKEPTKEEEDQFT